MLRDVRSDLLQGVGTTGQVDAVCTAGIRSSIDRPRLELQDRTGYARLGSGAAHHTVHVVVHVHRTVHIAASSTEVRYGHEDRVATKRPDLRSQSGIAK